MGRSRRSFVRWTGAIASGALGGCASLGTNGNGRQTRPAVVVGSKGFTEQQLLGSLSIEALAERTSLEVIDQTGFGGSLDNWQAVVDGRIDTYWEYTGTKWLALRPRHQSAPSDPDRLWRRVRESAAQDGVRVLPRAGFTNPFVLVVSDPFASETGIETLSDLAAAINDRSDRVILALGSDFFHRRDGWPGLVDHYGIDPAAVDALDDGETDQIVVLSIGLSYELLESGDATVVMGFKTDAELARSDRRILRDDRDFYAPYNPAPMVNAATADRFPSVVETLSELGPLLDSAETMRELNARVEIDGERPRAVARSFLRQEGIIS